MFSHSCLGNVGGWGGGGGGCRCFGIWHVFVAELVELYCPVLNEQGTGYEYLKEHPNISKFTKFESYWFKRKGMVHF